MKLATFVGNAIKDGKVPILSTLFKFGEGIGYFITGDWQEGLESWSHILPSLLGGKESPLYKSVAGGLNAMFALAQENAPAVMEKAGVMAGDAWGFMKKALEDIGNVFASFFEGIKNWVSETLNAGKEFITSKLGIDTGDITNEDGSVSGTGVAKEVAKTALKASPIGMATSASSWLVGKIKDSMQDGIVMQNGRPIRIDSQDQVLAAKSGGPIDKLLDQNSTEMKTIANINAQQLNVLVEIRDSNAQIRDSLKSGGNLTFSNASLAQEFFE
jgi:hypothetical protein